MYRDDELARATHARALIDEIAELERLKVAQVTVDARLRAAKHELAEIVPPSVPVIARPPAPCLATHVLVFAISALLSGGAYACWL